MRILILSCNTGEGHNSCAAALKENFDLHGETCVIEDALAFISKDFSQFISRGHAWVYRHAPSLFRSGYTYSERHPALFQQGALIHRLLTSGVEKLHRCITDGGYDVVICAHVFASLMLSQVMEQHHLDLLSCFVATDYTCSPGGKYDNLDFCFIPDDAITAEYQQAHVDKTRIMGSGIPIRKMFLADTPKASAKKQAGVCPDHKHLLMMCGSMGCGPMKRLAGMLSKNLGSDMELTILCGTNRRLYRTLSKKMQTFPSVHVRGYEKNISLLMDSADLYLTKPGGISVTEAAAKHLPMAFVDAVAGCEEYNRRFFVQRGTAITADTTRALSEACLSLLANEERLNRMSAILYETARPNASESIYQVLAAAVQCHSGTEEEPVHVPHCPGSSLQGVSSS